MKIAPGNETIQRRLSHFFPAWNWLLGVCVLALIAHAHAEPPVRVGAEAAWAQILTLDSGPRADANSTEQSKALTLQHLARQEQALRGFLSSYPDDAHGFGAKLRLAHLLAVRSDLKGADREWMEAMSLLDSLEGSVSPERKPDVAFARISLFMRRFKPGDNPAIESLLAKARSFQQNYPQDRRVAPMLAEIATLFDEQPAKKESLLQEARRVAIEPGTQKRIDDDLKRLSLLDKPLDLKFVSVDGKPVDLKEYQGKIVFVVFFAEWSAPSLKTVESLQSALKSAPQAQALGISLDKSPEKLAALMKSRNLDWPIFCDGLGWNSPMARSFGINSLPTVWLVDRAGILRRLNVRGDWEEAIRRAAK